MLNLSHNLGLTMGMSIMGAVFSLASQMIDIATAHPEAVATGAQTTFASASLPLGVALVVAAAIRTSPLYLFFLSLNRK